MNNSILIITGENSGERYGADLVRQFKKINPNYSFSGIGGNSMKAEGVKLLYSIEEMNLVGIVEIITHLPHLKKIYNSIIREAQINKPKAIVFIDSPDFNLRLAKRIKKFRIPILYYISPTVWAWRQIRLKTIKKTVDKMLLIFPFEKEIYEKNKIPYVYVGHPLIEKVKVSFSQDEFFKKYNLNPQKELITILPGSREIEIKHHMPVLIEAIQKLKKRYSVHFIILKAENIELNHIKKYIPDDLKNIPIISNHHYEAIASSILSLASCGTANLESSLLGTPFISFYYLSPLTYKIGINFIKINHYSIVNILAGKTIIPELIQNNFTSDNIYKETVKIMESKEIRNQMKKNFISITRSLGKKSASQNAALELNQMITKNID
ncbi:MAG: lipid-A-disaccharide synthase [Candidatus Aminicenantaceae bacterium]